MASIDLRYSNSYHYLNETMPLEEALKEGRDVIEKVSKKIVTTYDVFPDLPFPFAEPSDFTSGYERYGLDYLNYLQHVAVVERTALVCEEVNQDMITKRAIVMRKLEKAITPSDLQSSIFSANLAITHFHLGEALQASTLATLYLLEKRKYCFVVTVQEAVSNRYDHSFVLLNIDADEFTKKTRECSWKLFEVLKKMKNGVIIDTILKVCCSTNKKNNSFFSFIKKGNLTLIRSINYPPLIDVSKLIKQSETIAEEADNQIKNCSVKKFLPRQIKMLEFVKNTKNAICQTIMRLIQEYFFVNTTIGTFSNDFRTKHNPVVEFNSHSEDQIETVRSYCEAYLCETSEIFINETEEEPVSLEYRFYVMNLEKMKSSIARAPSVLNSYIKYNAWLNSSFEDKKALKRIAFIMSSYLAI